MRGESQSGGPCKNIYPINLDLRHRWDMESLDDDGLARPVYGGAPGVNGGRPSDGGMRASRVTSPLARLGLILLLSFFVRAAARGDLSEIGTLPPPRPAPPPGETLPSAFRKDAPSTLNDLRYMERYTKELIRRVAPAVVSVRAGNSVGSGVVISEDGIVLCAAHVCGRPDVKVTFTFPDGKEAEGRTLGTDHELDAGLMKITDPGTWPHAAIAGRNEATLGDWVLALGHPGGFDPERSTVARLGRVIHRSRGVIRTDCTLIGGDSGGPLFDMHGRVIGIHSRISDSVADNYHVPIGDFLDDWSRLAKGENWGGREPGMRSYVGARGVDDPDGCRIESVSEESPAAKAGLKVGDVVKKIDGVPVQGWETFVQFVRGSQPGAIGTLLVQRDGREIEVKVTVEMRRGRGGRGRPAP
jgi:serine protease Do